MGVFVLHFFPSGIVQMDPLDNNNIDNEVEARETGDNDRFEVKLIPLQRNSYLGECLVISKSVWLVKPNCSTYTENLDGGEILIPPTSPSNSFLFCVCQDSPLTLAWHSSDRGS